MVNEKGGDVKESRYRKYIKLARGYASIIFDINLGLMIDVQMMLPI